MPAKDNIAGPSDMVEPPAAVRSAVSALSVGVDHGSRLSVDGRTEPEPVDTARTAAPTGIAALLIEPSSIVDCRVLPAPGVG